MVDLSAGKKLSAARLARNLSIDAAAHATKMRPDKILALENDDYTRFGSNAYAKGFLLIYSRFLRVDVADQLRDLDEVSTRVNIQGYQYLNNAPTPTVEEPTPVIRQRSQPPSVVPLLVFVIICVLAGVGMYVKVTWHRLGMDAPAAAKPVEVVRNAGDHAPPEPKSSTTDATTAAAMAENSPAPPEPAPPVAPPAAEKPPAPVEKELTVEPLRKTYVKIRESQNSPILYEDYLYPIGKALKLHGHPSFFVEVRDGAAVQIRLNGKLVAYQQPGVMVE